MRTRLTVLAPQSGVQPQYLPLARLGRRSPWPLDMNVTRPPLLRARWHPCFDDLTYLYDVIRREHSPPTTMVAAHTR